MIKFHYLLYSFVRGRSAVQSEQFALNYRERNISRIHYFV